MPATITIFKRWESKFMLTGDQTAKVRTELARRLVPDDYFQENICNIYYDSPDWELARRTLDHPPYREKVRMRSYEVPGLDDRVFLELKKKFDGVVYKRREAMTLREAEAFARGEDIGRDSQILRELRYAFSCYRLEPKMYLAYFREAYHEDGSDLRITLDSNVRYRLHDLTLGKGDETELLLPEDTYLMEVKTTGALPLWLVRLTSSLGVGMTTFSKYAKIYQSLGIPYQAVPEEEEKANYAHLSESVV